MRKVPSEKWIKDHTVAFYEKCPNGWSSSGLLAVVDGNEAGIVEFSQDSFFNIELTEPPLPEQLFDIPECCNPWDYISDKDYLDHPKVKAFQQEINWLWEGTKDELLFAAKNNTDLMFPDRKITEDDVDFKEMTALYADIRKYLSKKERKKKSTNTGAFSAFAEEDEE